MTIQEAFPDGRLAIYGTWHRCSLEDVTRWVKEHYCCDVETWLRNRERWEREDAECSRRELYPTPTERVTDAEGC